MTRRRRVPGSDGCDAADLLGAAPRLDAGKPRHQARRVLPACFIGSKPFLDGRRADAAILSRRVKPISWHCWSRVLDRHAAIERRWPELNNYPLSQLHRCATSFLRTGAFSCPLFHRWTLRGTSGHRCARTQAHPWGSLPSQPRCGRAKGGRTEDGSPHRASRSRTGPPPAGPPCHVAAASRAFQPVIGSGHHLSRQGGAHSRADLPHLILEPCAGRRPRPNP